MFPPLHFIGTYLFTIVLTAAVLAYSGDLSYFLNLKIHMASLTVVLMSLMVRIMDEFKDYEDDFKNFPNRPLPSGRVKKEDLKVLQMFVVTTFVALSSYNPHVFIACLITLAYSGLMYKWFFIEDKMRKSLPLAFATHNPVIIFYFGYICTVLYKQGYLVDMSTILVGLPIMLTMTNWEISRKLRAPKDETDYTTYSKIWGAKRTAFISLGIQSIIYTGIIVFLISLRSNGNHTIYFSLLLTGIFAFFSMKIALDYLKFIRTFQHNKSFKAYAEDIALVTQLTVLVASILRF